MSELDSRGLSQNDKVNPDAAKGVPCESAELGGSGSTHGSFSAIQSGSTRSGQTRHRVGVHKLLNSYDHNLTVDQINYISDVIYNEDLDGDWLNGEQL